MRRTWPMDVIPQTVDLRTAKIGDTVIYRSGDKAVITTMEITSSPVLDVFINYDGYHFDGAFYLFDRNKNYCLDIVELIPKEQEKPVKTLRDEMAIEILFKLDTSDTCVESLYGSTLTELAYKIADAMLKAREVK